MGFITGNGGLLRYISRRSYGLVFKVIYGLLCSGQFAVVWVFKFSVCCMLDCLWRWCWSRFAPAPVSSPILPWRCVHSSRSKSSLVLPLLPFLVACCRRCWFCGLIAVVFVPRLFSDLSVVFLPCVYTMERFIKVAEWMQFGQQVWRSGLLRPEDDCRLLGGGLSEVPGSFFGGCCASLSGTEFYSNAGLSLLLGFWSSVWF